MSWRREAGPSLLALFAGSLITLSLAPYNIWPAAILSCCLYLGLLRTCSVRTAIWRGWLFGLGLFGTGASWVYVSIHDHGNAGVPLAALLTLLFCGGLALLHALFAWLYTRFLRDLMAGMLVGFPALWVLMEWLRSWLLTGFPWLYIGYSTLDTWAEGWVPVIGVFGVSLLCAFSASCFYLAYMRRHMQAYLIYTTMVASLWFIGWQLQQAKWVAPASATTLSVGIVQANIPQDLKWRREYYEPTLDLYRSMTTPLLGKDIVLWPESAIPNYYQRAQGFLLPLSRRAYDKGTALVTGIPWRVEGDSEYHNSIVALAQGSGEYHKQRLVPFGEYVPLEGLLRGMIDFFNLPMSAFSAGDPEQAPLILHDFRVAPFICYEIVYPDLVRDFAQRADLMITISNDNWFGDSIGPIQHLQMARMRALENGRYLIRGTNNGISAIINERGKLVASSPQFERVSLEGEAQVMLGATPFSRIGSMPIIILCALLLALVLGVGTMGLRLQHD
ncbi:MAG: apolipoprotein N-acyltransferase [Halieaceae bacterium]